MSEINRTETPTNPEDNSTNQTLADAAPSTDLTESTRPADDLAEQISSSKEAQTEENANKGEHEHGLAASEEEKKEESSPPPPADSTRVSDLEELERLTRSMVAQSEVEGSQSGSAYQQAERARLARLEEKKRRQEEEQKAAKARAKGELATFYQQTEAQRMQKKLQSRAEDTQTNATKPKGRIEGGMFSRQCLLIIYLPYHGYLIFLNLT